MITLKGSRKTQRRQQQLGAILQLAKIEELLRLSGNLQNNESPAQCVKRLLQENNLFKSKDIKGEQKK